MRRQIAAWFRTYRSWLTGEVKSEVRAYQHLEWVTRHLSIPIPSTTYSLQPVTTHWVLNEIMINNRTKILELGAGTSTQIFAQAFRLLAENGPERQLYSIEENEYWTSHVNKTIAGDGNSAYAQVHYVPRKEGPGGYWYDEEALSRVLKDFKPDVIVVDGPSIKRVNKATDRARVFHYFRDRMNPTGYTIFIDDTTRPAERKLVQDWAAYMGAEATYMNAYLGVATKGEGFNSRPN